MSYFNEYLLESFNTNKITIQISNEEFNKIDKIIKRLQQLYTEKVNSLYEEKRSLSIMNQHCILVKEIITEVISQFPIMEKYGACAFLTGSFARCSCKKNSDLDFHIIYLKKYNYESFKYEEIIYYMLSSILNLGRNKIHPMLITKMHPEISKYLEEKLDTNDLNIIIKSNSSEFKYKINANLKRRLYLQYCRENSINKVFSYLKEEIDKKNSEWAHVIYPITMKKEFNNYYKVLYDYEKNNINVSNIILRINYIKEKINKISKLLNTINYSNISEFKMVFQKKEFSLINEYISLRRDIYLFNKIDWKTINYYDNLKYLENDYTFIQSLQYMFLLFDITEPLGNRYSLHTNELIEIDNLDIIKNKIKDLNRNIMENIMIWEEIIYGKSSNNHANSAIQKILTR